MQYLLKQNENVISFQECNADVSPAVMLSKTHLGKEQVVKPERGARPRLPLLLREY